MLPLHMLYCYCCRCRRCTATAAVAALLLLIPPARYSPSLHMPDWVVCRSSAGGPGHSLCISRLHGAVCRSVSEQTNGEMTRVGPPVRPVWENVARAGANHLGRDRCLHPCLSPPSPMHLSVHQSICLITRTNMHTNNGRRRVAAAHKQCCARLLQKRMASQSSFHLHG